MATAHAAATPTTSEVLAPGDDDLVPVAGEWALWRDVAVRSAGFPVSGLAAFGSGVVGVFDTADLERRRAVDDFFDRHFLCFKMPERVAGDRQLDGRQRGGGRWW